MGTKIDVFKVGVMKRVLFVESYPHVLFGQQLTLLYLLSACGGREIEPVVAVTADGSFTDAARMRGIQIIHFPYPDSISGYGGAIYRTRGLSWLRILVDVIKYIFDIRRKLRQLNITAVFCNDMRGLLTVGISARLLGLPVMIWDKLDKPHFLLDWFQIPLVSQNIIISEAVKVKYPSWQKKIFRRRIKKISEGVDLAIFESACSIRNELPGTPQDVLLAIVGSITHRKGHDRIFSIWPEILMACPSVQLLVIGETSSANDEEYFESLPNRDHPRIHFFGMRKDVPDLMKSIDILLIPSRHEGMGLVVIEAMAAKIPVIGSDAGGIPEAVSHEETGIIVNGDDGPAWIHAINRLAVSHELRVQMGCNGYLRVEKEFNRPVQMSKILELFLEMTDGK